MTTKLKLRVGDVVRLKPVTIAAIGDLDFLPEESCREGYIELDMIEEIIFRAETPEEEIERLRAGLASAPRRIQWYGGECPVNLAADVVVWFNGPEEPPETRAAEALDWSHTGDSRDIVAYMVLPE